MRSAAGWLGRPPGGAGRVVAPVAGFGGQFLHPGWSRPRASWLFDLAALRRRGLGRISASGGRGPRIPAPAPRSTILFGGAHGAAAGLALPKPQRCSRRPRRSPAASATGTHGHRAAGPSAGPPGPRSRRWRLVTAEGGPSVGTSNRRQAFFFPKAVPGDGRVLDGGLPRASTVAGDPGRLVVLPTACTGSGTGLLRGRELCLAELRTAGSLPTGIFEFFWRGRKARGLCGRPKGGLNPDRASADPGGCRGPASACRQADSAPDAAAGPTGGTEAFDPTS